MIQKNGRKVTHKCPGINIHVNTAESSCPPTIMFALSVEKLTLLVHKGAQNAETPLKQAK
jgi:hypothetical protein